MAVRPDAGGFVLSRDHASLHVHAGRFDLGGRDRVAVGVRPGHLEPVAAAMSDRDALHGVVDLIEYLGNDVLLHLDHAGVQLSAIVSASRGRHRTNCTSGRLRSVSTR